jgi:hypothetical protein
MPGNWLVVATLAVLVTLLGVAVWVSRVVVRFLEHFRPTKVKVRVVEHKAQAGGSDYALLYEVLEPRELQGRYGLAATLRGDLVDGVDGVEFEVYLNWTMIGPLGGRPGDYSISSPESKSGDFLEMAERVR